MSGKRGPEAGVERARCNAAIESRADGAGLESVRLIATGEDVDKLAQGVLGAVAAVVNEHGSRSEFSGEMRGCERVGRPNWQRFGVEWRPSAF